MRYTTVIDISEFPALYRSASVRQVYIHMSLKAGYHDTDRDIVKTSIRMMAAELGLTVSAVRHAITVLQSARMVQRVGAQYMVTKYCVPEGISKRPRTRTEEKDQMHSREREERDRQREMKREEENRQREMMEQSGKTPFMVYYEGQMKKAASGDVDAQRAVERGRKTYEEHSKQMKIREAK